MVGTTVASACTPYDYPIRFGERGVGHAACLSNLTAALEPWGIHEHLVPDPMNVFMNQVMHEDGTTEVLEPLSRAGDTRTCACSRTAWSRCPRAPRT